MRWIVPVLLWAAALKAQPTVVMPLKPVVEEAIVLPEQAERRLIPIRYRTYELDKAGLQSALSRAPREFTPEARQRRCVLSLPLPDGTQEAFSVWETFQVEPALAEAMPAARTYAGEALHRLGMTVRFSYTQRGLNAYIFWPDLSLSFVEVYAWGQDRYYMAYGAEDLPEEARIRGPQQKIVVQPEVLLSPSQPYALPVEERGSLLGEPVQLKQYRLIISTTGEFSEDHGGTRELVYAALVDHVNRINAAYERDFSLRFVLVQATLATIFLNPATDPFSGTDNGALAAQNQQALALAGVPPAAYDVGHVFARGGGGVGGLGVVCMGSKWLGCTSGSGSYGLFFTYVACQELGHQLGGNHTWNRCGGFAADQRAPLTAYEPGSGSTIMSYVGGCGPDNVQGSPDLYFHGGSIEEMRKYIDFEGGAQCGSLTNTGNQHPTVSLPYADGFFIPIGTPFELTGTATDPDGDALTYCWEQMDIGPETPLGTQLGNSPIFRTRPAVSAPNRYFPQLSTILNGTMDSRELLPEYTRNLTFMLTVRDGRGGVGAAEVSFKSWGDAGPFTVEYPNQVTDRWNVGEYAEVRWNVANTDKAPVNCSHVRIRLSTDGGLTYPIVLAERVSNDGSHFVRVPNVSTTQARVRVDGADNVFFDISNRNFTIQQPTQPSLTLGLDNDSGQLCLPAEHTVSVHTAGVLGFNAPVTLSLDAPLPPGVAAAFSKTTLSPGESATLTLDFSQVNTEETFTLLLRATAAGVAPIVRPIVLTTIRNDFSSLALVEPPTGATEQALTQTLRWNRGLDALTYDVQLATSPSFEPASLVASVSNTALDSFKVSTFLDKGTAYFWRVRPRNECGTHAWTAPSFFSTIAEKCVAWEASDLPKNLTANGKPVVESKINVLSGGAIKNMEVRRVKGYHEFFRDLDVRLISPQGTEVVLWSSRCGNFNGFFNLRLTDASPNTFPCPPPNNGLPYRPQTPLAAFTGQNAAGVWTLRVQDTQIGGGGTIEQFQLEFCAEVTQRPPVLVNNNPLVVQVGNNHPITPDLLLATDPDNTPAELVFTLLTVPQYGHLAKSGSAPLQPGAQFTQADINNGAMRFFDYGTGRSDGFLFIVSDGQGGFFGTPRFRIEPQSVSTHAAEGRALDFHLYPNPAREVVWLAFELPTERALPITLFDSAGRLLEQTLLSVGSTGQALLVSGYAPGLYLVQVGPVVKRLILVK